MARYAGAVGIPEEELEKTRRTLSVERWIRDKADRTLTNYLRCMVFFNRSSGMDPDQFLAWAKARTDPFEIVDLILKTSDGFTESNRFQHRVALRSFLRCNGFNNLPREKIVYTPQDWHRGYRRDELSKLYGYLDSKMHKLYLLLAVETGFRANTVLALQYHHVKEDFEDGTIPCAVRLEPRFYKGKKSAGFTFLGERSVAMMKECVKDGEIKKKADSPLVPLAYTTIFEVLGRAREKAGIDSKIQPNHGLRKFYENSLDKAELDEDMKALLKGHLAGVDVKHYSDRSWETLRPLYLKAYPFLDFQGSGPEVAAEFRDLAEENKKLKDELARLRSEIPEEVKRGIRHYSGASIFQPYKDQIHDMMIDIRKLKRAIAMRRDKRKAR